MYRLFQFDAEIIEIREMKKTINGEKYNFVINLARYRNNFYFEIEAIDLKNNAHSFINNVNCILSELNIKDNDAKFEESQWEVEEKEGKQFFEKAINFTSSKKFKEYLEKQLDLDQELGEWNKI